MVISCKVGLKIKVNKQYEEDVIAIGYRLVDTLAHLEGTKRKQELILLLKKLNDLDELVSSGYQNSTNQVIEREKRGHPIVEIGMITVSDYSYVKGKISILKSIINFYLDKLNDAEIDLTSEEQEEIVKKSKRDGDLSYLG